MSPFFLLVRRDARPLLAVSVVLVYIATRVFTVVVGARGTTGARINSLPTLVRNLFFAQKFLSPIHPQDESLGVECLADDVEHGGDIEFTDSGLFFQIQEKRERNWSTIC